MTFDEARDAIIALLKDRGRATNRSMIALIGGDSELFEEIREDLILEDLAEDKKGVGLVFIGEECSPPVVDPQIAKETKEGAPSEEHGLLRIFLSYGHDRHTSDALRIKEDFERRGHQVWFDLERLQAGRDWESYIEEGLRWCDKVVLLMTPYSVRRRDPRDPASRDGFCLNEIAKAIERNKLIIPVLLVELEEGPPTSICRIQYLDLSDAVPISEQEEKYRDRFHRLVRAVEEDELDFEGNQARLARQLKPLHFEGEMARHIARFSGRRWLVDRIDDWLASPSGSRVFWLTGGPGVGKTALATHLCHTRREVIAYHLCVHNHQDKIDPARAVLSLAYQVARHLPEYEKRLYALPLEEEVGKNAETLFDNLIVQPLARDFPEPDGVRLIIVDGLDEATREGRNPLATLIGSHWSETPSWLRLLLTSRPEIETITDLAAFRPFEFDAGAVENLSDLREYVEAELGARGVDCDAATVETIVEKSEGVFLYATVILDELSSGALDPSDLDAFPLGLAGYYQRFFRRRFPNEQTYRDELRPVLETICAQRGPLPLKLLARAIGLGDLELRRRVALIGSFFPVLVSGRASSQDDTISPFHRSIRDWLTAKDERTGYPRAGEYAVDEQDGEARLAETCWQDRERGLDLMSPYTLAHLPLHLGAAGRSRDLLELLGDMDYLYAKVSAHGPGSLVADCAVFLERTAVSWSDELRAVQLLQGAIRMSDHILSGDPDQIASQIVGRTLSHRSPALERLLEGASRFGGAVWLRPGSSSLAQTGGPLQRTMTGHEGLVFGVAVLDEGRRAISASWDGTLRVWNLDTGTCLQRVRAHGSNILALALSSDGKLALTGSRGGGLRTWDVGSLANLCERESSFGFVGAVATTSDGARAVSGYENGDIEVWDARDGEIERAWRGHQTSVRALAVTADDKRVVSGGSDGVVRVWDIDTGKLECELSGQSGTVYSLSVSPDGRRVASAGEDRTIALFELETGELERTLRGHEREVVSAVFGRDGKRLFSGSWDKTVKIWNPETGELLATLADHLREVESIAVTPDGGQLVSTSWDKTVKLWDLTMRLEKDATAGHEGDVLGLAISPDGELVASAGADEVLRLWRVESSSEVRVLTGHSAPVQAVAFTPSGDRIVSGAWDGVIKVWSTETGELEWTLEGHEGHVLSLSVTTDGRFALSRSRDKTARVWDLAEGKEICRLVGHEEGLSSLVPIPGQARALTTSFDRTARVWNLETGEQEHLLVGHDHWIQASAVTADGRFALTASSDKTIKVWDLATGVVVRTLEGHESGVTALALTPDGSRVISGSFDKSLKIWSLDRGTLLETLDGHTHWVNALECSGDGKVVVSGSADKSVRIWDIQRGARIAAFTSDSAIRCVVITPDSRVIVAGAKSGPVHFLRLVG